MVLPALLELLVIQVPLVRAEQLEAATMLPLPYRLMHHPLLPTDKLPLYSSVKSINISLIY